MPSESQFPMYKMEMTHLAHCIVRRLNEGISVKMPGTVGTPNNNTKVNSKLRSLQV